MLTFGTRRLSVLVEATYLAWMGLGDVHNGKAKGM